MEYIHKIYGDENGDFLRFPDKFVWGVASSPTQIEGETVNEWAKFTARDGRVADDGSHHWRRYRQDFRMMAGLGLRAYRLGFDWGRLQKEPFGEFDKETRFRYLEMLAELRGHGIEPYLTLFHHACPQWLAAAGGWLNPQSPEMFADFAAKIAELSDGEVRNWITINEPNFYAFLAYIMGVFPPWQKARLGAYHKAVANMRKGHILAYRAIRGRCPEAKIGITTVLKDVSPARAWHPLDRMSARCIARVFSHASLEKFLRDGNEPYADFLGINYCGILRTYNLHALSPLFVNPAVLQKYAAECDDQWEQNPAAMQSGLKALNDEFKLPLYITGHGISAVSEQRRLKILRDHLCACHAAIRDGIDLRGYFYWSLLDNFDWNNGLRCTSGLLAVDFDDPDRRRELRRTGCVFGEIVRRNGLARA